MLGREGIIMSVDRHLVLVLAEMWEGVRGFRVVVKVLYHDFFEKRSVIIFFDNGESVGLIPLYFIPFRNCWLAWLSLFWIRYPMSSNARDIRGLGALRVLEVSVEWVDSRVRLGDGRAHLFLPPVGVDCDFHCVPICLRSRIWTRVAVSFSRAATSQSWIISVCWFFICFCMVKSIWRSWSPLSEGSDSAVCIPSGKEVLEWESSASEI